MKKNLVKKVSPTRGTSGANKKMDHLKVKSTNVGSAGDVSKLVAAGFSVIKARTDTNSPVMAGWPTASKNKLDKLASSYNRWKHCGLMLGIGNLSALDIDFKNIDPEYHDGFEKFVASLKDNVVVERTKSNGYHIYFLYNGEQKTIKGHYFELYVNKRWFMGCYISPLTKSDGSPAYKIIRGDFEKLKLVDEKWLADLMTKFRAVPVQQKPSESGTETIVRELGVQRAALAKKYSVENQAEIIRNAISDASMELPLTLNQKKNIWTYEGSTNPKSLALYTPTNSKIAYLSVFSESFKALGILPERNKDTPVYDCIEVLAAFKYNNDVQQALAELRLLTAVAEGNAEKFQNAVRRMVERILSRDLVRRRANGVYYIQHENKTHWEACSDERQLTRYLYKVLGEEGNERAIKEILDNWLNSKAPDFIPEERCLNVRNGVIEPDGKFTERKGRYFDYVIDVDYDSKAKGTYWEKLISPFSKEENECLQDILAAPFVGKCLNKAAAIISPTGYGKTEFVKPIIALFGGFATTIPLHLLADPQYTVGLMDKKLNIGSESSTAEAESDMFKRMTSWEVLIGKIMRQNPFTFVFRGANLIICNNLPRFKGESVDALITRFAIIEMKKYEGPKIPEISALVIKDELSAVLNWVVAGLKRVARDSYRFSYINKKAEEEYKNDLDSTSDFRNERLVFDTKLKTHLSKVYGEYRSFCEDSGRKPVGLREFKKRLPEGSWEVGRDRSIFLKYEIRPKTRF